MLADSVVTGGRATFGGKPGGFWFARDRVWVDLMTKKGTWNITAPLLGAQGQRPQPYIAEAYACVVERACPTAEGRTFKPAPPSTAHFVYRFSLDDALVTELSESAKDKVFRLTADNEKAWLADFDEWAASVASEKARLISDYLRNAGVREEDPRARHLKTNRLLADYYSEAMKAEWGGIYFDGSLFTGAIEPGSWKANLEVESGCLWNPRTVLKVPAPGCVAPNAVIAFAGSAEQAATRATEFAPYRDRLFLGGVTTDDHVAFFQTPRAGGRRGRTYRSKAPRRNKNGRRPARQSQRRIRNRHT